MKKSIFRWGFVLAMLVGLLTIGASAAAPEKTVCNGHPTEGDVVWTEVREASDFVVGGHNVLMNDLDFGSDTYLTVSADTTICLNGHTLKGAKATYGVIRFTSATLTICDCSEEGTGEVYCYGTAPAIYSSAGGTVKLEGGTIKSDGGYALRSAKAATVNIMGGTVKSGTTAAIRVLDGSTINVYGGTLEAQGGGRIFHSYTGVNIYGGTFKNDTNLTLTKLKGCLPTDIPMSVLGEEGNFEVKTGFYRSGGNHDFKECLNFRLFLQCDNGYITDNEDFSALTWETSMGTNNLTKSSSMLVFRVYKLTAKDIGTPVTFTVKASDGTVLFEETLSVADMAKEQYEASEDAAFKTLMEDLVNYGNAAAEAFGGTTVDALGEGTTVLTQDWTRGENDYGVTSGDHNMYATLSLKNTIELNIYHEDAEGNVTYQTLSDIAIANALTSSDVTFDDGCSVKYSIKDYILDVLNGEDNGQQALISALQKYIDSLCAVVNG